MKRVRLMSDERPPTRLQPDWVEADCDEADLTPSAGAMLKRAREASGLPIAALAVSLKVPVKKLEALEQDRLELLPDAMFARALASSVCRSLKLDPTPVLQRLPQTSFRASSFHEQRPAVPFQLAGRRQRWPVVGRVSRPVWALGLAMLTGAVLLLYFPEIKSTSLLVLQEVQSRSAGVSPSNQNLLQARASASTDTVPDLPRSAVSGMTVVKVEMPAAKPGLAASNFPGSSPLVAPVASERADAARYLSPSLVTTPIASPTTGAMLTVTASKESWVKVIDAKGAVLLSRLLMPGEVAQASGFPPLDAVVGRADVVRVEVRGKWLDLSPLSRDNVARFEVK